MTISDLGNGDRDPVDQQQEKRVLSCLEWELTGEQLELEIVLTR